MGHCAIAAGLNHQVVPLLKRVQSSLDLVVQTVVGLEATELFFESVLCVNVSLAIPKASGSDVPRSKYAVILAASVATFQFSVEILSEWRAMIGSVQRTQLLAQTDQHIKKGGLAAEDNLGVLIRHESAVEFFIIFLFRQSVYRVMTRSA